MKGAEAEPIRPTIEAVPTPYVLNNVGISSVAYK
jgi:hypothetical protein